MKFKKLFALSTVGLAAGLSQAHAALPDGVATTVNGYITEVGSVISAALLLAAGAALTMVIIKYVKRAGK